MIITPHNLNSYLNEHISKICGEKGYVSNDHNHCAHFVSHALKISYRTTCAQMTHGAKEGATIRVQDLFTYCSSVGSWSEKPSDLKKGLIFITAATNVCIEDKYMENVPRKHVGIFLENAASDIKIWHYSNSKKKVVSQSPDEFSNHYRSPYNALFFGELPR